MKRILIISRGKSILRSFRKSLGELGLKADLSSTSLEMKKRLGKADYEAIIIDAGLLGWAAKDIRALHERGRGSVPVLVLTDGVRPKLKGLKPEWVSVISNSNPEVNQASTLKALVSKKAELDEKEALISKMQQHQEKLEGLIKEKSEMLEESLLNYYTVVEHIQDAVAIVQEGRIVFTNKKFCSMLGYCSEEILGHEAALFFPPEISEMYLRPSKPLLKPDPRYQEAHVLTKSARLLPVEINVERTTYNKNPSTLIFIRDITERKDLQTKLIHTSNLAAIGQIAVGLAHDLNTPLANISLLTENVSSRTADEAILKKLATIHDQIDIITNTVKNLVVFYRRSKDLYSDININEVVLESLDRAKDFLTHHMAFELKLDDSMPTIQGSQEQLSQVFLNIILNADDAVGEDGELIIRTYFDRDHVLVELRDNGCGIQQDDIRKIYDPFYTTKKPNKGVGLGLSICQGIVHSHAGRIDVRSKVGKGTTFTITLKR